jgi:hypothetical protein
MENYYREPFICNVSTFKNNGISQIAVDFLKVDNVPSNFRKAWNLLLNFFEFGRTGVNKYERFQSLANICYYEQGPAPSLEKARLRDLLSEHLQNSEMAMKDVTPFRQLFAMTFYHLAVVGAVRIPVVPVCSFLPSNSLLESPWVEKLPREAQFFFIARSKEALEKHFERLDVDFKEAAVQWFATSSGNQNERFRSAGALLRHYFAVNSSLTLDVPSLAVTLRAISALTTESRSIPPILEIYSAVRGEDLKPAYKDEYNSRLFKLGDVDPLYHDVIVEERLKNGIGDPSDFSRSANFYGVRATSSKKRKKRKSSLPRVIPSAYGDLLYKQTTLRPDGCTVFEIPRFDSLKIGGYFISLKGLRSYLPENIGRVGYARWWSAHQKDFVEKEQYEKSTVKTKGQALKILNAYLFSYLPWFKENVDSGFSVPENLLDFDPNLFIRRTHSFMLRVDGEKQFPITLPEFLRKVSDMGVDGGSASPNVVASKARDIAKFFDSCIALEGYSIPNPMDLAPKTKGFAYAESQKLKIDYFYWWLLRVFLFEFAKCACYAAKEFFKLDNPEEGAWEQLFLKYASDSNVEFAGATLQLSEIKGLDQYDPESAYAMSALLCLISQCAIRFQNALWLDARNFDSLVNGGASNIDGLIKIFVNTDKAQLRPFHTHVKPQILELLRDVDEIRSIRGFDKIIDYQNNENSKWGKILPLFRCNDASFSETTEQGRASTALSQLVFSFQSLLKKSDINLDSYIYPSSPGIKFEDYQYCKATSTQAPMRSFVIDSFEYTNPSPRPVCLFKYKASMTIHSFRKTFDSFFSNFLDREVLGELFTGQTPEVVGYYTSNSISDVHLAKKIAEEVGLPFPVGLSEKDSSKVIDDIKKNGISDKVIAISAADADEFDLNEEYRRAAHSDIAVNRTHICPYNNQCPKKIRAILDGKKLCGICPAALSFPSDAPAIAAQVRKLGDEIADLSNLINSGELISGEAEESQHRRISLIAEFSAWVGRHDLLIGMSEGEILIGEDGHGHFQGKLRYQKPQKNWSEDKKNLWRIFETSNVKTMQSERLKSKARRYARRLVPAITSEAMDNIDVDPVHAVTSLFHKHAQLNGVTFDQVIRAIEQDSNHENSVPLLKSLIGESIDE